MNYAQRYPTSANGEDAGVLSAPEAAVVADLSRRANAVHKHPHADGLPFVVLLNEKGAEEVEFLPTPEHPERRRGTVKLTTAEAFCDYLRHMESTEATPENNSLIVYASQSAFVAVLNDHRDRPGYRDWRAIFAPEHSAEWKRWRAQDKQKMTQEQFGLFLEDNLPDVAEPDGATLLELAMNFEASSTGAFRSVKRLQDGTGELVWSAQNSKDGGQIVLPPKMTLSIPVYERGKPVRIDARIKFRLNNESLSIWYEIVRPHKIVQTAFDALAATIKAKADADLMVFGSPE